MAGLAPRLSAEDLRAELTRFHAGEHRTLHTAFYGTGKAEHITVTVLGEQKVFRVAPVDCELRLREELAKRTDDEPLVLLVDYTDSRLPIDVEGRLARGGLLFISPERRLATLFGAKAVAPALLDGPLGEALLRDGKPFEARIEGSTVDEQTAWRLYLERLVGLSSLENLTEQSVVGHFAALGSRPAASSELESNAKLREAATAYLRRAAGPIAEIAFGAWLAGRGLAVAALSFVIEPLAEHIHDGYVLAFLEGQLSEVSKGLAPERALLERWKAIAPALDLRLGEQTLFERMLADADTRVRDKPKLERYLASSRHLSSGLQAAKAELALALDAAVDKAGSAGRSALAADDVAAVIAAQKRVSDHRLADTAAEKPLAERLMMTTRLLAYLVGTGEREAKLSALTTPIEVARELADHYATEGGFVDYARRSARAGASSDALGKAIARVLALVDSVRDAQDTRFGPALKRWNEERKSGQLVPIENVLEAFGIELLNNCPDSKLLILLMDGMAWHAAVEILFDLREVHYGPLRFTPKQTSSTKMPAPMIAALPTMTEVSRAALFAGKLLKVGEKTSTLKDPDRMRDHRAFVKLLGQGPRLLLRTEAEDNAGHLTADARKLVQSKDRVVALVVNAVDDMLSAKPSYRARYNRETIKALTPLLEEARAAHRAVLLVADHGHVQSDRERQIVKVEGADSPRYRELGPKSLVSERELVLDDANTYRQRAGDRVALLFRESDRYKDAHNLGEHGGASLSEVVTPALLIGADDLYQSVGIDEENNEALQTIAWPVPAWWNLELPTASKRPSKASTRPAPAVEPAKKPKANDDQLTLTQVLPQPAAPPVAASVTRAEPSEWSKRVDAMYAGESKSRREELKRALVVMDLLLDHGGRMSDEVLAGKLGQAQRNIGGLVAIMGEFLNVDGYDVVRYSVTQRLVELDVRMLAELFGETS